MTPTERLLDLVAFLLAARRPVPIAEIYEAFSDEYVGSREARDRKFSRDKEDLRALGIPLSWYAPEEEGEDGGYAIDRSSFYLPDIRLSPDERAALFSVGAAAMRSAFPLRNELALALTKLRASGPGTDERARPTLFALTQRSGRFDDVIARAVAERRKLKIRYPPEQAERLVDPYAFSARRARMVLVGFCHLRGAIRTFASDRMVSCELASPKGSGGEFSVPEDFNASEHLPRFPWQLRMHPPVDVELAFSPELAESGSRTLGIDGTRCTTTNLDGLVSQVLALGSGVRIVSPPEARQRLRERLSTLAKSLEETP